MPKKMNLVVPASSKKVVFYPRIRPFSCMSPSPFRRPGSDFLRLKKQAYTYINPRYDTTNPLWRPVAPRGRSVAPSESSGASVDPILPPTWEAYHGSFGDELKDILEPCGSMMERMDQIEELRSAMQNPPSFALTPSTHSTSN